MVEYLIKSSLILAVLCVFYKLILEKESFFAANRIYLVACLVLTYLLPFVSLPQLIDNQGFLTVIIETGDNRESLTLAAESLPQTTQPNIIAPDDEPGERQNDIVDWLLWLYYFGVGIFATNFFIQVVSLLLKAGKSTDRVHDDGAVIISNPSVREPCSFFRYIFIDPERYDYETYEQILAHEKIHVKKLHAADLMLAEITVVLLWFNPVAWIFRKEIEKNVEYETDSLMVKENAVDKEVYQMNLLKIATRTKPLAVTTNYNQSLLTHRILRMNAKKSNFHSYWKYAFIAPLVLAMLVTINKPIPAIAMSSIESGGGSSSQDVTESAGCQSLLRAVKGGDIEDVRELLKTVDPNCTYRGDGEPRSPLVAAARNGDLLIGRLLIEAGADVEFHAWGDETPLMAASAHGHLDFVKHLLAGNADINRELGGDGSALLVAARQGHLETVRYLISRGADVNSQINGDGTPLICSVRNNHYEVSRVLLENGADPFLVSPGDEYAMYHARMSGNKDMIELLEKYFKRN